MCGIVGYVGDKQAAKFLLEGLNKLEYRGYDSAGIAVYNDEADKIRVEKSVGRLASGLGAYIKQVWPECKVIGVEPAGAASMKASLEAGHVVDLDHINKFVDGAAVKKPGRLTYAIISGRYKMI